MKRGFYYPDSAAMIYAGKNPLGELAMWLQETAHFLSDLLAFECLSCWPNLHLPDHEVEKTFLMDRFAVARADNRYIQTQWHTPGNLYETRAKELTAHGLKDRDAYHAALAERHNLTFVSSDKRLNRALAYLTSENLFSGELLTFSPENAEEVFGRLNRETNL